MRTGRWKSRRRPLDGRSGAVSLEALVAIPVLLMATLAVAQFAVTLLVEQAIVAAVTTAAREGTKGANLTQTAALVAQYVGGYGVSLASDGNARLIRETGTAGGTVVEEAGNPNLTCTPTGPVLDAGELRVTLCVRMTDATQHPVPNWLQSFGVSLTGRTFHASSLAWQQ